MKNINNYIQEKLYIGKGYKTGHGVNKGDNFAALEFYFGHSTWDEIVFRIYPPFTVLSIDDNKIKYTIYNKKIDLVDMEFCVNSKGYYQVNDKDSKDRYHNITVLLYPDEFKEILEMMIKERIFNPKYKDEAKAKLIKYCHDNFLDIPDTNMDEFKEKNFKI